MIFVSIASYMDDELPKTVHDMLDKADDPSGINIGIVEQNKRGKFHSFNSLNISKIDIPVQDAKGAGYARKRAMELYAGEEFFMQIDSHMRFEQGWDTRLKAILAQAQEDAGTEKVILSAFPAPYFVGSDGRDYFPKDDRLYWSKPSWTAVSVNSHGQWAGQRREMEDLTKPHKSHTILAGYVFTIGSIVSEVPYDARISFMGEELCFAIRAYTRGWEIYAPHEVLLYHFYKREQYPKIWKTGSFRTRWMGIEKDSFAVQKDVLTGMERGIYGIEDYDRFFDYQDMVGIDFYTFYEMDRQNYMENMSALEQEIFLDDAPALTRFCINELHDECKLIDQCECNCHERTTNARG